MYFRDLPIALGGEPKPHLIRIIHNLIKINLFFIRPNKKTPHIFGFDQARNPTVPEPQRENGYIESFNGKMRDELLNGEIFYTLKEAEILIEM